MMGLVKNTKIAHFQLGYISYQDFNQKKGFKYQVERSMSSAFQKLTVLAIKKC